MTCTDTDAESRMNGERGNDISADTDQTMGDCLTTKPNEAGQPSPSPDDKLVHGRQTPNSQERRQCVTPQ